MNDLRKPPSVPSVTPSQNEDVVGQIILLSADQIVVSDDPNRGPDAFRDEGFERLKESIDATRGNTQPVQVDRRINAEGAMFYELVSGYRRVRACAETGHAVRAEVIERTENQSTYLRRLAENALRKDLSPLERGRQIEDCFRRGAFTLESVASRTLGIDASDLNKLRRLGQLDEGVVAAFASPNDLQFRHAKPLHDALALNPEAVLTEARRIAAMAQKPAAATVVELLQAAAAGGGGMGRSQTVPADLPLCCEGQAVGQIKAARDGSIKIELTTPLEKKEREQLAKAIEAFMRKRATKSKPQG